MRLSHVSTRLKQGHPISRAGEGKPVMGAIGLSVLMAGARPVQTPEALEEEEMGVECASRVRKRSVQPTLSPKAGRAMSLALSRW